MAAGRGAAEAVGMPEELADTSGRATGTGRAPSFGTAAASLGTMPMAAGMAALGPRVSTGLETAIRSCEITAAGFRTTSVDAGIEACSGMAVSSSSVVLLCGLTGTVGEAPRVLSSLKSYRVSTRWPMSMLSLEARGNESRQMHRKTGSDMNTNPHSMHNSTQSISTYSLQSGLLCEILFADTHLLLKLHILVLQDSEQLVWECMPFGAILSCA